MKKIDAIAEKDGQLVIAIIGAGQLGYLLCQAARSLGIKTLVVTPDKDAPALTVADECIVADYLRPGLAQEIAALAKTVTFELEAVPDELLQALQDEGLDICPDVSVFRRLKNKARQKQWMIAEGIPTADYIELSAEQLANQSFLESLTLPFVQKSQEGGYDGYGVQIIRNAAELKQLWPVPSIVETFLDGARELAVVVARSACGEIQVFPPVEMAVDQERNILDMVIAPAPLDEQVSADAIALAHKVIDKLKGVGVFAVEMFFVEGQLLVNEISPRVHNSGHHTLESCSVSQFEQHMRAVAGLPLIPVSLHAAAVMKNILFEDSLEPLLGSTPGLIAVTPESIRVHWYGKRQAKKGRKMGHVTCIGEAPERGSELIDEAMKRLQEQGAESS